MNLQVEYQLQQEFSFFVDNFIGIIKLSYAKTNVNIPMLLSRLLNLNHIKMIVT
jgi:hypothetical protein